MPTGRLKICRSAFSYASILSYRLPVDPLFKHDPHTDVEDRGADECDVPVHAEEKGSIKQRMGSHYVCNGCPVF